MNNNNNNNNNSSGSNGSSPISLPFTISLLPSTKSSMMISSPIAPIQRSLSTTTSVDSSKKRQRSTTTTTLASPVAPVAFTASPSSEDVLKLLKNIHPKEYVKTAFKSNGYDDVEAITSQCVKRFNPPTPQQLAAYSTDILLAVRNNDLEKAKVLFGEGKFNCNACNRFGESILHIACRRGHFDMVKFFIEDVGMKVDEIRDDYQRTPLHDAFWTSKASPEVIDYLLKQPYVVELLLLQDKRGYTPLDYARSEDRTRWLHFLWERKHMLVPTNDIRKKVVLEASNESDDAANSDDYDDDFTTSTMNDDDLTLEQECSDECGSNKRRKLQVVG